MKYYIFILSALIVAANVVYADEKPEKRILLLKECINIAVENSTSIKASVEDKNKALADYKVATAQRLFNIDMNIQTDTYPHVSTPSHYKGAYERIPFATDFTWNGVTIPASQVQYFGTQYFNNLQPQPSPIFKWLTRDYDLGLSIGVTASVSLYDEKKARNQAMMKKNVEIYKIQNTKTINDVILTVKNLYYNYYIAKVVVMIKDKQLKSNHDRIRMTEILYKNALKSVLDLNRAKYDYQNAQLELQKAVNAERNARIELFRNMGIQDNSEEFTLEELNDDRELSYTVEQLNSLSELNSPELQLIKKQSELFRARMELDKASHYPEVLFQLAGGYRNSRIDFAVAKSNFSSENWKPTLGVNFIARIPIFSSGMIEAKVASSKAEYNKALLKEKDMQQSMKIMVENQYITVQDMKKQIELSKIMKDNAEKNWIMAKKSYETGSVTQLELQDAMMAYENAEMNYQRARFDYLMAIAKISSMVGLGEDTLCKK
ncbi:MAG: TolC family protein [Spirochaetes bacterium]|nr:TolC family protein [Spirochaetota bacterium]